MSIYYIIFFVLSFLSILKLSIRTNKFTFKFIIFFIILFVGIRYNVGNDYIEYYLQHIYTHTGELNYFEPLFLLMNYITQNPYQMFFLSAVISFALLYQVFKYFAPNNTILAFTLYYGIYLILFNIHIVRQGIALAIILYSWIFAVEKKKFKFYFLVIIAMGFHKSAIVAFPVYILSTIKIKKRQKIAILIIASSLLVIFQYFKNHIFNLMTFIPGFGRYASVYANEFYSSLVPISFGFMLNLVIFVFFEVFSSNNKINLSKKELFISNVFFISIVASVVLRFSAVMLRLNYYYQISNIFILILIMSFFRQKLIIKIVLLIISLLYLYMNLNTGHAILEYKTIFSIP